jgi:hypothetical protein
MLALHAPLAEQVAQKGGRLQLRDLSACACSLCLNPSTFVQIQPASTLDLNRPRGRRWALRVGYCAYLAAASVHHDRSLETPPVVPLATSPRVDVPPRHRRMPGELPRSAAAFIGQRLVAQHVHEPCGCNDFRTSMPRCCAEYPRPGTQRSGRGMPCILKRLCGGGPEAHASRSARRVCVREEKRSARVVTRDAESKELKVAV